MIKMTQIKPSKKIFDAKGVKKALEDALDETAYSVREMEYKTVNTWDTPVKFDIDSSDGVRVIGTSSKLWAMLDKGTKPHRIRSRRGRPLTFRVGGRPKTTPRVIGSRQGSKGTQWVRTGVVFHPGTAPREWTIEIAARAQKKLVAEVRKRFGNVFK